MLNDGQTLGNCGFTNQTARPQAPATVGLAFRLSGKYFTLYLTSLIRPFSVSVVIMAPFTHRQVVLNFISSNSDRIYFVLPIFSLFFTVVTFCLLSFSQMIHLSSWGSSLSPLPQSSLTSWSPRTRAAQPMSRLYSEGGGRGNERDAQRAGGRMHGGRKGLNFGEVMPQRVSFILPRTDLQLGIKNYKHRFSLL